MTKDKKTEYILYAILVSISLISPLVSYAGVSLIYPSSTLTASVNTNPPITWAQGQDYSLAQSNGFAGSFSTSNNAASFTLTVSGLSGGTVTVDKLLNLTAASVVSTFKVKISSSITGTLSPAPTTLKLRFWTGSTAPTNDGDPGVAAILDLMAALNTETSAITGGQTLYVQLVYTYASGTTGSSNVSIQPSSIALT